MQNNGKMAIIGDKDSVLFFKAVGLDVFPFSESFKIKETIKKLTDENYKIIIVMQEFAEANAEFLEKYNEMAYPIILPIPDSSDHEEYGKLILKRLTEKAIGSDVILNNK